MSSFLRQATASQTRTLGPFVDDTDFKTAETGLTIANTDVKLVVNGGASANKNSGGGTHRINGMYGFTFDATDTATVGEIEVSVVVSGALPVFKTFTVVEEAVYDALFAAAAAGFASLDAAGVRTALGLGSANLDTQLDALPTNAELATALGTADDAVLAQVALVKAKTDLIPSDPADASDVADAFSAVNTSLGTITGYLDTEVAAIKAKTDNLPASPAAVGSAMTLTGGERTSIAEALLKLDLSTVTGEASRSMLNAIRWLRNRWTASSTTLTVYKEDDSTPAWTSVLTRTSSDAPSESDPS